MNYYFIYSAGGGAGDWNGVKRVWQSSMPQEIKSSILLKFGDIYFNHVSSKSIIRPRRWNYIDNLREWLYESTGDSFVLSESNILLDSGSAKIVGWIAHHNKDISCKELISLFDDIVKNEQILDKYVDVIIKSGITNAITFDIPNPFKIRSQNGNTRLNILDSSNNIDLIKASAKYANEMYRLLKYKAPYLDCNDILMTTINGAWDDSELKLFFSLLDYKPKNLAIGGLSSVNYTGLIQFMPTLIGLNLHNYNKVHFLGCGGLKKIEVLKDFGFKEDYFSVDVSTPINRSIDGNTKNTSFSCYYDYTSLGLHRINDNSYDEILDLHKNASNPCFSDLEMNEIINDILDHQHGKSSTKTYDSRAKLIIHNNDVYRQFAKDK